MASGVSTWSVLVGVRVFVVNLVMQVLFVGVEWVQLYGWQYDGPVEDFGPTLAVLTYLYPAMFTVLALLVLLVLPRGRRIAVQCLFAPSSLLVYALFLGGWAVSAFTTQDGAGYALGWLAVLIASITQFEVEDRGPQPWLGSAFLLIGFAGGLLLGVQFVAEDLDDASFALPDTALGWVVAVANVAILVWALRGLWREHRRHFAEEPSVA